MAMYRTIPCQNCLANDGTVCGAHSNQSKHGKGRGIKASDKYCASLCSKCHAWLDFGTASREEKIECGNWRTKTPIDTCMINTEVNTHAY